MAVPVGFKPVAAGFAQPVKPPVAGIPLQEQQADRKGKFAGPPAQVPDGAPQFLGALLARGVVSHQQDRLVRNPAVHVSGRMFVRQEPHPPGATSPQAKLKRQPALAETGGAVDQPPTERGVVVEEPVQPRHLVLAPDEGDFPGTVVEAVKAFLAFGVEQVQEQLRLGSQPVDKLGGDILQVRHGCNAFQGVLKGFGQ